VKGSPHPPPTFFFLCLGVRDIYLQQILFFSTPTFSSLFFPFIYRDFLPFFCSQIMWDKKMHMQSTKSEVKEGHHIATSYDVLRAILLRKANAVTWWCNSLGLSNSSFVEVLLCKITLWMNRTPFTARVDQQLSNTPSIHPSIHPMYGWMNGWMLCGQETIYSMEKKSVSCPIANHSG
jgi:hypothetical protein